MTANKAAQKALPIMAVEIPSIPILQYLIMLLQAIFRLFFDQIFTYE